MLTDPNAPANNIKNSILSEFLQAANNAKAKLKGSPSATADAIAAAFTPASLKTVLLIIAAADCTDTAKLDAALAALAPAPSANTAPAPSAK